MLEAISMLDRRPLIEREANAKRFATVAILSCFLLPLFGCGIDDDFDPDLYAVDFADGAFVAVGQEYAIKNSVDGDDFRLQAVGDDGSLRSIAFGKASDRRTTNVRSWPLAASQFHRFLPERMSAVGESGRSNWSEVDTGTSVDLNDLVFAAGTFVAVGAAGTILTAIDGATWEEESVPVDEDLLGVGWGDGLFVVVGKNGTILTSTDASTWSAETTPTTRDLNDVVFSVGTFVAVGGDGTALASNDGSTWTEQNSRTGRELYDVTYGNGVFVAVGEDDKIRNSPDGIEWN
jgi:hypothetical protein